MAPAGQMFLVSGYNLIQSLNQSPTTSKQQPPELSLPPADCLSPNSQNTPSTVKDLIVPLNTVGIPVVPDVIVLKVSLKTSVLMYLHFCLQFKNTCLKEKSIAGG